MSRPAASAGCTTCWPRSHPGLERALELTTKGGLWLASRYVTPAEVRAAGRHGLLEHLQAAGGLPSRQIRALADRALAAAAAQQQTLPAEQLTAELVRELATEVGTRSRPWESRSVAVDGAKVSR